MEQCLHRNLNKSKCIDIPKKHFSTFKNVDIKNETSENNHLENVLSSEYYLDYNNFFPSESPPNDFIKTLEKRYKLYHHNLQV